MIHDLPHEFARFRVQSVRYSLSVTGDISFEAFVRVNPYDAAAMASCADFEVNYVGQPHSGLPTFNVIIRNAPKDPLAVLNTIKARLEGGYDDASGEPLVR